MRNRKLMKIWENGKSSVYIFGVVIIALVILNAVVPSNMATIKWLDTGETVTMENSYQLGNYNEGDSIWVCTLWGNPGVIYNKQEDWSRNAVITKKHGCIIGGIKTFIKYNL